MSNRGQDWFAQALRDVEQAEDSYRAHRHEWACFAAHQAAEKAVIRIGLIGSYACGDWGAGSDVDVIVLVSETPRGKPRGILAQL